MAGFFKVLWRINAVLAFVALIAVIGFVVLLSKERIDRPLLAYFVPPPAAAVVPKKPAYRYELEKDLLIGADTASADFELYRLVRWGKIDGKPMPPEASATVNLLVADKKSGATKWLFEGFDRTIINQETVLTGRWYWREPEADDDVPVEIVVLKVIDADTNGDGALTLDDRQALYVARFPAAGPVKLLEADAVWFTLQKNKEYQVGYRDRGEGYLATYALPDFTLVSKTKIEGLPQ
jgi:hypothetical protein